MCSQVWGVWNQITERDGEALLRVDDGSSGIADIPIGAGYQVTAVKDGTAALRESEAQPFDLILLDIRMPGIDGLTLLAQVRERRPDAQVVIMTAHGTVETAIRLSATS